MPSSDEIRVVPLGSYPSTLRIGDDEFEGHAEVEFILLDGDSELQICTTAPFAALLRSAITNIRSEIRIGGSKEWVACLPFGESDDVKARFRLMRSLAEVTGHQQSLASLVFGLIDFRIGKTAPILEVKSRRWLLKLIRNDGIDSDFPTSDAGVPAGFSHRGVISRIDSSTFDSREVSDILARINLFTSFCCERWVAAGNAIGIDPQGQVATRLLGVGKFDKIASQSNWLDEVHLEGLNELFACFLNLTDDREWWDTCRSCIYWYLRADVEAVGPDGALILMQAALERLSWQVLDSRKCLSEDGFAKLAAADKLRLALSVLGIPLAIPSPLVGLLAPSRGPSFTDGPMAIVEARNALTHSAGKKAVRTYHFYEAFTLSKWYFELFMLSILDYKGLYSNRTIKPRWSGQVERVPWVAN